MSCRKRTRFPKMGMPKQRINAIKAPRPFKAAIIGRGGISIQTVHAHPIISKYG